MLPWTDLMQLQVLRKVGRLLDRRWGLGLGYATPEGQVLQPPRPGTVGLHEVRVPVVIDGVLHGSLLAGGFTVDSDPPPGTRNLTRVELGYLHELIELCAEEIVAFQNETTRKDRRLEEHATRYSYDAIIGRSLPMQELYRLLDKVIDSDSTVLVQGENGTGKELIAKAIHYNSARKNRRFVIQNCSAFNDNLLDSELFGHKKGAFTGAIADKQGLFEVADGGTFFLDEIGDMSPALQVKLLRVLQEGTFIPVGDTSPKKVDVRIIAATNRDLKRMVERAEFREDLYYRINVINLVIPPLRERRDDITVLIDHFLKKHGKGRRNPGKRLARGTYERMLGYPWPGNVRELENEIERLLVLSGDERLIGEELLSPRIRQYGHGDGSPRAGEPHGLPDAVASLERSMIHEALRRNQWNKTRAAADLRISRRNLIRLVQKYKLERVKGAPVPRA
jgi:two-component system, NtrC family, response regulator HupR/HoxA